MESKKHFLGGLTIFTPMQISQIFLDEAKNPIFFTKITLDKKNLRS